jgi:hypothetical protein
VTLVGAYNITGPATAHLERPSLAEPMAKWIAGTAEFSIYLNRDLIEGKNLDESEVERTVAQALLALAHVFHVYTRSQLMNGTAADPMARRVPNGFNFRRSRAASFCGDMIVNGNR